MDALAVEIAVEIEQYDFQQRIAQAGCRVRPKLATPGRQPVSESSRAQTAYMPCAGCTISPSCMLAVGETPACGRASPHDPRPRRQSSNRRAPCLLHPPRRARSLRGYARRNFLAVARDFLDDVHFEAEVTAKTLEGFRAPIRFLPNRKSKPTLTDLAPTCPTMTCLQEFAVRHRRHGCVELQQVHLLDTQRIERDLPSPRRHEAEWRSVGLEEPARRRFERRYAERCAETPGRSARFRSRRDGRRAARRNCPALWRARRHQVTQACLREPSRALRPSSRSCRRPRL